MRSTASLGIWMRLSASARLTAASFQPAWAAPWVSSWRPSAPAPAPRCGSFGTVIRFHRMPAAVVAEAHGREHMGAERLIHGLDHDRHFEQRDKSLPHENLLFLAADEHCDLPRCASAAGRPTCTAAPPAWADRWSARVSRCRCRRAARRQAVASAGLSVVCGTSTDLRRSLGAIGAAPGWAPWHRTGSLDRLVGGRGLRGGRRFDCLDVLGGLCRLDRRGRALLRLALARSPRPPRLVDGTSGGRLTDDASGGNSTDGCCAGDLTAGASGADLANGASGAGGVAHAPGVVVASASWIGRVALNPSVGGFIAIRGSAGFGFGANRTGCAKSTGASSGRAMITRTPSLVVGHSRAANSVGRRMQPCEAGYAGQHALMHRHARPGDALHEEHRRVAVDVRPVKAVLLDDAEYAHRGRVAGRAGRNRRLRHADAIAVKRKALAADAKSRSAARRPSAHRQIRPSPDWAF